MLTICLFYSTGMDIKGSGMKDEERYIQSHPLQSLTFHS